MSLLKYIWRNVARNKLRSSLTILSVGFSLALMTVLHGYMAMQNLWSDEAKKYNRIVVMNIQGFSGILPIANVDRVRKIGDVKAAVPYSWFGGKYRNEPAMFAIRRRVSSALPPFLVIDPPSQCVRVSRSSGSGFQAGATRLLPPERMPERG